MITKTATFKHEMLPIHFESITDYSKQTNITFSQASSHWKGKRIPSLNQLCLIAEITKTQVDDWISYE